MCGPASGPRLCRSARPPSPHKILAPAALTRSESQRLERALDERVATTTARIEALTRSLADIISSSEGSPPDDEHDPDGATSGFERAQVAALLETAKTELAELELASDRLRDGDYGICENCGEPIAFARLEALPNVRTCVRCAGAKSAK